MRDAVMVVLLRLGHDDTAHGYAIHQVPAHRRLWPQQGGRRTYHRALAPYDSLAATHHSALASSEASFHLIIQLSPQQQRVCIVALRARGELPVTTRSLSCSLGRARLGEPQRLTLKLFSHNNRAYVDLLQLHQPACGWSVSESMRWVRELAAAADNPTWLKRPPLGSAYALAESTRSNCCHNL